MNITKIKSIQKLKWEEGLKKMKYKIPNRKWMNEGPSGLQSKMRDNQWLKSYAPKKNMVYCRQIPQT